MTTDLDVDLRELFVMPHGLAQPSHKKADGIELTDATAFMKLAEARQFFGGKNADSKRAESAKKKSRGQPLLGQVRRYRRIVIVGLPGSGKSTFLEWLQLQLAAVEEELVMARAISFSVFAWLSLGAPRSSVASGAGLEPGVPREIGMFPAQAGQLNDLG